MLLTKNKFEYMGYKLQEVSQNIKLLYMSEQKGKHVSYALSFDGGETWNIGRNKKTYISGRKGSPQETVEICLQINQEYDNEKE